MDTWTYGDCRRAAGVPRPPDRLVGHLDQGRGRGQSLRQPRQRPALRHRPQHDGVAAHRGQRRCATAERDGRVRPQAHSRAHPRCLATANRSSRWRSPSRRDRRSPLDGNLLQWQNWSLRVGFNHREGMTLHTDPLPRRRPGALGRAPDLVRRDDGAVPRLVRGPLPAHRVRHRRVGSGLHDDVAGTGLRLPRRDPLPRRGAAQQQGRAVHDHQRDLHPRGGQRRAVEARRPRHRRRGAPDAPADGVVPRDRRQLRVPGVLAASTRTATSNARSAPPASW